MFITLVIVQNKTRIVRRECTYKEDEISRVSLERLSTVPVRVHCKYPYGVAVGGEVAAHGKTMDERISLRRDG